MDIVQRITHTVGFGMGGWLATQSNGNWAASTAIFGGSMLVLHLIQELQERSR